MSSKYSVLEVESLTQTTIRLRVERPDIEIVAGQCFNIGLPGESINREYSMYSDASADYVDFLVKVIDNGCLTPLLARLQSLDKVELHGPYGEFKLWNPTNKEAKYVFIATGTGIAPFHSFIETYPKIDYQIIHGVRFPDEAYHASHYLKSRYESCVSQNAKNLPSRRVTDHIMQNPINSESIVYLCGNRNMITDTFQILRDQGVPGDNLFTEVFF
jgi:ferredoxin-NADP reductase